MTVEVSSPISGGRLDKRRLRMMQQRKQHFKNSPRTTTMCSTPTKASSNEQIEHYKQRKPHLVLNKKSPRAASAAAAAATPPRATTPRATTPRATTPRATTPRVTTPRAKAPRATTPTKSKIVATKREQIFRGGKYKDPPGIAATGSQECKNIIGGIGILKVGSFTSMTSASSLSCDNSVASVNSSGNHSAASSRVSDRRQRFLHKRLSTLQGIQDQKEEPQKQEQTKRPYSSTQVRKKYYEKKREEKVQTETQTQQKEKRMEEKPLTPFQLEKIRAARKKETKQQRKPNLPHIATSYHQPQQQQPEEEIITKSSTGKKDSAKKNHPKDVITPTKATSSFLLHSPRRSFHRNREDIGYNPVAGALRSLVDDSSSFGASSHFSLETEPSKDFMEEMRDDKGRDDSRETTRKQQQRDEEESSQQKDRYHISNNEKQSKAFEPSVDRKQKEENTAEQSRTASTSKPQCTKVTHQPNSGQKPDPEKDQTSVETSMKTTATVESPKASTLPKSPRTPKGSDFGCSIAPNKFHFENGSTDKNRIRAPSNNTSTTEALTTTIVTSPPQRSPLVNDSDQNDPKSPKNNTTVVLSSTSAHQQPMSPPSDTPQGQTDPWSPTRSVTMSPPSNTRKGQTDPRSPPTRSTAMSPPTDTQQGQIDPRSPTRRTGDASIRTQQQSSPHTQTSRTPGIAVDAPTSTPHRSPQVNDSDQNDPKSPKNNTTVVLSSTSTHQQPMSPPSDTQQGQTDPWSPTRSVTMSPPSNTRKGQTDPRSPPTRSTAMSPPTDTQQGQIDPMSPTRRTGDVSIRTQQQSSPQTQTSRTPGIAVDAPTSTPHRAPRVNDSDQNDPKSPKNNTTVVLSSTSTHQQPVSPPSDTQQGQTDPRSPTRSTSDVSTRIQQQSSPQTHMSRKPGIAVDAPTSTPHRSPQVNDSDQNDPQSPKNNTTVVLSSTSTHQQPMSPPSDTQQGQTDPWSPTRSVTMSSPSNTRKGQTDPRSPPTRSTAMSPPTDTQQGQIDPMSPTRRTGDVSIRTQQQSSPHTQTTRSPGIAINTTTTSPSSMPMYPQHPSPRTNLGGQSESRGSGLTVCTSPSTTASQSSENKAHRSANTTPRHMSTQKQQRIASPTAAIMFQQHPSPRTTTPGQYELRGPGITVCTSPTTPTSLNSENKTPRSANTTPRVVSAQQQKKSPTFPTEMFVSQQQHSPRTNAPVLSEPRGRGINAGMSPTAPALQPSENKTPRSAKSTPRHTSAPKQQRVASPTAAIMFQQRPSPRTNPPGHYEPRGSGITVYTSPTTPTSHMPENKTPRSANTTPRDTSAQQQPRNSRSPRGSDFLSTNDKQNRKGKSAVIETRGEQPLSANVQQGSHLPHTHHNISSPKSKSGQSVARPAQTDGITHSPTALAFNFGEEKVGTETIRHFEDESKNDNSAKTPTSNKYKNKKLPEYFCQEEASPSKTKVSLSTRSPKSLKMGNHPKRRMSPKSTAPTALIKTIEPKMPTDPDGIKQRAPAPPINQQTSVPSEGGEVEEVTNVNNEDSDEKSLEPRAHLIRSDSQTRFTSSFWEGKFVIEKGDEKRKERKGIQQEGSDTINMSADEKQIRATKPSIDITSITSGENPTRSNNALSPDNTRSRHNHSFVSEQLITMKHTIDKMTHNSAEASNANSVSSSTTPRAAPLKSNPAESKSAITNTTFDSPADKQNQEQRVVTSNPRSIIKKLMRKPSPVATRKLAADNTPQTKKIPSSPCSSVATNDTRSSENRSIVKQLMKKSSPVATKKLEADNMRETNKIPSSPCSSVATKDTRSSENRASLETEAALQQVFSLPFLEHNHSSTQSLGHDSKRKEVVGLVPSSSRSVGRIPSSSRSVDTSKSGRSNRKEVVGRVPSLVGRVPSSSRSVDTTASGRSRHTTTRSTTAAEGKIDTHTPGKTAIPPIIIPVSPKHSYLTNMDSPTLIGSPKSPGFESMSSPLLSLKLQSKDGKLASPKSPIKIPPASSSSRNKMTDSAKKVMKALSGGGSRHKKRTTTPKERQELSLSARMARARQELSASGRSMTKVVSALSNKNPASNNTNNEASQCNTPSSMGMQSTTSTAVSHDYFKYLRVNFRGGDDSSLSKKEPDQADYTHIMD